MNFRDLEYVIESGKTLSFSKAAVICNVSQPSLSAQIKKLEEELGAEIFIRHKRKIHLTSFGEAFIEQARDILSIRQNMQRLANENRDPLQGKITLGGILTVAPYMFPNIVSILQKEAPDIKLSLKEAKTKDLIKDILDGHVDAAIISLPTDDNIFETHSLFTEQFYVAVPNDHHLASRKIVNGDDLTSEKLILLEEGHCFRTQALDVCRSSAAQEHKMFNATSLETIRHFVAIGEGVTLMPAMAVQPHKGVSYIPLSNQKFSRTIGVIWRKNCTKRRQIEKLISLIK